MADPGHGATRSSLRCTRNVRTSEAANRSSAADVRRRPARGGKLKSTHFRGPLTVTKEGVRDAQDQAAVRGVIQAADREPGMICSSIVLSSRASLLVAIAAGLLAGIGYPSLDLALACRAPASEACVWAKAYFPLTLGLSLVLLGCVVAGLTYAALSYWRKKRRRRDHAV